MTRERQLWVRDWALIGGVTSALAPWPASSLVGVGAITGYAAIAALLGAVTGAAVGLFLCFALEQAPRHTRVALAAVLLPVPLGGWGALVAATSASLTVDHMTGIACLCGSVAALTQVSWLAPAYAFVARRGGPRLPLVVLAAVVAPACGVLATFAGVALASATL